MLALARPRRTSAAVTAAAIQASLKEEGKAGMKRRVAEERDDEVVEEQPRKKSKSGKSSAAHPVPAPKTGSTAASSSKAAATSAAANLNDVVLLGHVITRCVGIQHYRNNGLRHNKEPLHLKRQPNNRYDPRAIGVYTVGGQQVGHVEAKTGDVAAITRVADQLRLKMLGQVRFLLIPSDSFRFFSNLSVADELRLELPASQVESGAGQTYKFPLRVSFFGNPKSDRPRVVAALGHQLSLREPKAPKRQRPATSRPMAASEQPRHRAPTARPAPELAAAVAALSAAEVAEAAAAAREAIAASFRDPAAPAAPDAADDAVEFTGERSWEDRNRELLKHAIVLEDE